MSLKLYTGRENETASNVLNDSGCDATLASVAAAPVHFQGEAFFTAANAACADDNPNGSFARMRFRPANVGPDNGNTAGLSFINPRSADSFRGATSGNFPIGGSAAFKAVQAVNVGDGWRPYNAGIRFLTVADTPAGGFTVNTQTVVLTGQISRWQDLPGCIATFKAVLTRRPN